MGVGTKIGTATDIDGKFTLSLPESVTKIPGFLHQHEDCRGGYHSRSDDDLDGECQHS